MFITQDLSNRKEKETKIIDFAIVFLNQFSLKSGHFQFCNCDSLRKNSACDKNQLFEKNISNLDIDDLNLLI